MRARQIVDGVSWVGAVDWDRRLFDSLIPLPDGTSYNAYLVRGQERTVLLDAVDPPFAGALLANLEGLGRLDFLVAHHAEQDHSGGIPDVLERHPETTVLCSSKAAPMLVEHLHLAPDRVRAVTDGETLDLGGKTLEFIYTPWVHWPETMCTWLPEDRILFSCDFFGSHLATSDLVARDEGVVFEPAKRYYAEIMMPFRNVVRNNLSKVRARDVALIAPSHGPLHGRPAFIMDAYADWASDTPRNQAVVAYVSMHGSTRAMVERLVAALAAERVTVFQFDLAGADIGKLAIALVDAATVLIGTPAVHIGPHPAAAHAAFLANALRPKARFASVIGSYGWGHKVVEHLAGMLPNLKVEFLPPVVCKGRPTAADLQAVEALAAAVAAKHREAGLD